MQEVFSKIIERLETERLKREEQLKTCHDSDAEDYFRCKMSGIADAIEIVKQAAEYNNGWIPCSERLPDVPEGIEDDECPEFNVTIKGADQAATLKCASDGTWFDDLGYTYDVIAWQPLPDTYQPKGE